VFHESSVTCAKNIGANINQTDIDSAILAMRQAYNNGVEKLNAMI